MSNYMPMLDIVYRNQLPLAQIGMLTSSSIGKSSLTTTQRQGLSTTTTVDNNSAIVEAELKCEAPETDSDANQHFVIKLDPKKHLDAQFVRSQGPGGQNVNKLNTKVILRVQLASALWLPEQVKNRLQELRPQNMTQTGWFIVQS